MRLANSYKSPDASTILRRSISRLLQIWENRVRKEISAACETDRPSLLNSLPKFLDQLANILESPCSRLKDGTSGEIACEHGEQRVDAPGYSLDQVIGEYHILREILLEFFEHELPQAPEVQVVVRRFVDLGVCKATVRYVQVSELVLSEQKSHTEVIRKNIARLFEKASIGIAFMVGPEHRFEFVNSAHIKMTGADATGKAVRDINPGPESEPFFRFLDQVYREGKTVHLPEVSFPIQSHRKYFEVFYTPSYDIHNRVSGVMAFINDITNIVNTRKAIEEGKAKLTEIQAQLNLALVSGKMATWHVDLKTKEVTVSEGMSEIFGKKIQNDVFDVIRQNVHPEDREDLKQLWQDAIQKLKPYVSEHRIVRPDGSIRWILGRGQTILGPDGNPSAVAGVDIDFTERKQLEQKLVQISRLQALKLEKLDQLFQKAPIPIAMLEGSAHRFLFANKMYQDYFLGGNPPDGKTVEELIPSAREQGFIDILDRVFQKGERFTGLETPFEVRRPDGEIRKFFLNFVYEPIRESSGKVYGMLAVISDVTDLVQARQQVEASEALAREIANAMPQIVWTARPSGFVDWYNDWWYNYTGAKRGSNWDEANGPMHPDDVARTHARWAESLRTGELYQIEYRFKRASDGQYRWHLGRAVPVKNKLGQVVRWIGTNTDVHDQKVLQQELEAQREVRERFVAALTHDLRTPMSAARITAQLLERKNGDPTSVKAMSGRIVANMDRAEKMIRDLLDANRIKAGEGIPIKTTEAQMSEIVERVVHLLNEVNGPRFKIENEVGDLKGYWDPEGIRRILENLGSNAIKYGEPNTKITFRIDRLGDSIELHVHNYGKAIPLEEQQNLFLPYRRAQSALRSNQKGWGVGLVLVRGIAEAHHGSAKVESSQEAGTTFSVRLPIDARTP